MFLVRRILSAKGDSLALFRGLSAAPRTPALSEKRIWEDYKRNHKGQFPPKKTRLRCIRRAGRTSVSGNPCPICKQKKEIDYKDTALLNQFVSEHTGQVLEPTVTGVCRLQQKKLVAAIEKSRDYGLMPFTIPRFSQPK